MTIQADSSLSDPWDAQPESPSQAAPEATSIELFNSPAFPMILFICLAWLMLKGAVQLLCLGIVSGIFIYRRLTQLSQNVEAKPQVGNASDSSPSQSSNPALAMT